MRSKLQLTCIGLSLAFPLWASEFQDVLVTHEVTRLLFQLGVIMLAARAGGYLARKIHLPSLLGEVSLGLILGPYALGTIPLLGFSDGVFPLAAGTFPVSLQLYSFAAVGAVIHVLVVGLDSDIGLFSRIKQRGFAIALGSSLLALAAGMFAGSFFFGYSLLDRRVFFLAALSVSTSLGVQARILHSRNLMASPEGGAIFSASLLQDGFAIIFLAMAMAVGSIELGLHPQEDFWSVVLPVTLLALTILGGGTFLIFWSAPRLSRLFQKYARPNLFSVLVVGIAMFVSAFFEIFGVAAIIGAYVIGLAFSRTDIGDVLSEKSQPISEFFVPILYVVMGMLVDYRVLFSPAILIPGIGFALLSGFAKVIGSFFPALFSGFTPIGALRVGVGTVPRGEVALIIASVGLALGDFPPELFKTMIVMIVFSVALGSPLFSLVLKIGGTGTRGGWGKSKNESTFLTVPNTELSDLITDSLVRIAEDDGFFVHRLELAGAVYRFRKDEVYLTLYHYPTQLEIICSPEDIGLAKTLLYEVIIHVHDRVSRITEVTVPMELRREIASGCVRNSMNLGRYLLSDRVLVPLQATDKEGIIEELIDSLFRAGYLKDRQLVLSDVMNRERSVSTGLTHGIAIPHARSSGVSGLCLAAGVAPQGVDFQSLDGEPSRIIFLIISSTEQREPHLQLLAALASSMRSDERRSAALKAASPREFVAAILQPVSS